MTPDKDEQAAIDRVETMIYRTVRRAMADELMVYHAATVVPVINLLIDMQKSLGLVLDGQTLVEKHLAGAFTDPEEWRESLEE
jgi:hypothetical protein